MPGLQRRLSNRAAQRSSRTRNWRYYQDIAASSEHVVYLLLFYTQIPSEAARTRRSAFSVMLHSLATEAYGTTITEVNDERETQVWALLWRFKFPILYRVFIGRDLRNVINYSALGHLEDGGFKVRRGFGFIQHTVPGVLEGKNLLSVLRLGGAWPCHDKPSSPRCLG